MFHFILLVHTGESINEIEDENSTPVPIITPDFEADRALVPNTYDTSVHELDPTLEQVNINKDTTDSNTGIYSDSLKLPAKNVSEVVVENPAEGFREDSSVDDDSMLKSKTESFVSAIDGLSENQASQSVYMESSFEYIPDGMMTPANDASFRAESLANGLPLNLRQLRQKFRAPALPPRRSPQRKGSKDMDDELSDPNESSDEGEVGDLEGARKWIPPPTIKRPQSVSQYIFCA